MPTPDDLIIPTRAHTVRTSDNSGRALHSDLENLGFRARRGHDLRSSFPWPVVCAEVAKLQLTLPSNSPLADPGAAIELPAPAPEHAPSPGPEASTLAAIVPIAEIAARRADRRAGDTPGDSPDCHPKTRIIPVIPAGLEPATCALGIAPAGS